jgi:hypothetical protein
MRVCGFSFVRNAVRFDYPFVESVRSALPLCDEFVLAVGESDDGTLERARGIDPAKVRIIETRWDDSLRRGGAVLAQQTDVALAEVRRRGCDWALYLQADEVLHERDHPAIRAAIETWRGDPLVEGLLFDYIHFCGGYGWIGEGRDWYRREVRIVRPSVPGLASWKDAQGFRAERRKLRVKRIAATVYHYGWVKPPAVQQEKLRSFHRLWHPDGEIESLLEGGGGPSKGADEYDYSTRGRLVPFHGTHPAAMRERVSLQDWAFDYDPRRARITPAHRFLDWIEIRTGRRLGEYRNYRLV